MSTRNSEVGTKGQDRGVSLVWALLQLAVVALAYWLAALAPPVAARPGSLWPTWPCCWTGDAVGVLLGPLSPRGGRPQACPPALPLPPAGGLPGLGVGVGILSFCLFNIRLGLEYHVFPL